MAVTSSFFGSINGDRRYKPADFAAFFADFIGNGVYAKPSSGLQAFEKSNMTITVKPGTGFINGYRVNNDSDYDITLATADGVLKRIDRIVLQWDNVKRTINIVVKKGAFASNPVAPSLERTPDYYELALADVLVSPGVTRITQANITDQRLNNALCGIVTGLINQVDTTTLFNQYQSWFNSFSVDKAQAFTDWMATLEDILDENTAGNLLNLINRHIAEDATTANKGHVQLIDDINGNSNFLVPTQNAVRKKIEQTEYKITKSGKDSNGIFTTVQYRRKSDNTLAAKSVLSGGTSPKYTTRTLTYYGIDGTTIENTIIKTMSYDADGDLISEV
ncbi:hypothetical protein M3603_08475 [Rummeliibacillus stabekisii]|uniref:hypothetical protein n=1 Tax=Rummeliibacillus stabekisii TaxID=241244 RepID=UPI0020410164|nr:hypothetical protein [Rummeliibacillus stabekisii]MCM3316712.1 hypothetical protein [Rummeliibacillus stabekisii]